MFSSTLFSSNLALCDLFPPHTRERSSNNKMNDDDNDDKGVF